MFLTEGSIQDPNFSIFFYFFGGGEQFCGAGRIQPFLVGAKGELKASPAPDSVPPKKGKKTKKN